MEYCAGGGIIDMMNRRLRERLTESEILTIFVEVLEGVACMHNLKPALLHRDLKVENILQASEKSYKLCDFGSAATAALKSPTTTAEIRAIEQDLLRHTTLQYRAPEMVDPYLRLPIDEKSGECFLAFVAALTVHARPRPKGGLFVCCQLSGSLLLFIPDASRLTCASLASPLYL